MSDRTLLTLKERITNNSHIDENGCWIWQLRKQYNNYGQMSVGGKTLLAHRQSYIEFVGNIPAGTQIDHLCKVRSCVNPEHLECVTAKENVKRSNSYAKQEASRTHCKFGHEFTPDNIYKASSGNGRNCRTCMMIRTKENYQIKKLTLQGAM